MLKKDPFKLTAREQIIEWLSVITVALVLVGSFLKVLFL